MADVKTEHTGQASSSERASIDESKLIEQLRDANVACVSRTTPLLKVLVKARERFASYEKHHRTKDSDEGREKAERNKEMVDLIDQTLREFQERNPTS